MKGCGRPYARNPAPRRTACGAASPFPRRSPALGSTRLQRMRQPHQAVHDGAAAGLADQHVIRTKDDRSSGVWTGKRQIGGTSSRCRSRRSTAARPAQTAPPTPGADLDIASARSPGSRSRAAPAARRGARSRATFSTSNRVGQRLDRQVDADPGSQWPPSISRRCSRSLVDHPAVELDHRLAFLRDRQEAGRRQRRRTGCCQRISASAPMTAQSRNRPWAAAPGSASRRCPARCRGTARKSCSSSARNRQAASSSSSNSASAVPSRLAWRSASAARRSNSNGPRRHAGNSTPPARLPSTKDLVAQPGSGWAMRRSHRHHPLAQRRLVADRAGQHELDAGEPVEHLPRLQRGRCMRRPPPISARSPGPWPNVSLIALKRRSWSAPDAPGRPAPTASRGSASRRALVVDAGQRIAQAPRAPARTNDVVLVGIVGHAATMSSPTERPTISQRPTAFREPMPRRGRRSQRQGLDHPVEQRGPRSPAGPQRRLADHACSSSPSPCR